MWKQCDGYQTFQPIFTALVLLPYTLYTVQFQFIRHSLVVGVAYIEYSFSIFEYVLFNEYTLFVSALIINDVPF